MKPRDKEILIVCRPMLLRTLDVTDKLLPALSGKVITEADELMILSDPRRRYRTKKFLDILEKKRSEEYNTFLGVLEHYYPHTYLSLTASIDDVYKEMEILNLQMTPLEKFRDFVIEEVDVSHIIPQLRSSSYVTPADLEVILQSDDREIQMETLLDMVEMRSKKFYDEVINAIGDCYPHVFLKLIGQDSESDDGECM